MPKKLDWYIIRKFLGTFFFSIFLIILIVVIFDVSEKIDDFLDAKAPLKAIVFDYYLNFIPYFANLYSPLFCFIAVIFFTSQLATNTEFVAMLASGISFNRLLYPYFLSALFLTTISFVVTNFIIPEQNKKRMDFELQYIRDLSRLYDNNIHVQTGHGQFAYVDSYNVENSVGYQFTYEQIGDSGMFYKLSANTITWDTLKNVWRVDNYYIREINGMHEKITQGQSQEMDFPNLSPLDFKKKYVDVSTMGFSELRRFIKNDKMKGSVGIVSYQIEQYKRLADPFSMFIFTLIGVSLACRKTRGGMGFHLGAGIAIAFTYIIFMRFTETFSIYSNLPPAMAVWIPNILFGVLALYLLKKAPK